MRRFFLLIIPVLIAGASPATASTRWHSSLRAIDRPVPHLTIAQAHAAILKLDALDHPASVSISRCRQLSLTAIRCHVIETGVVSYWTLNDQPIVMTFASTDTVTLRAHRITDSPELLSFTD